MPRLSLRSSCFMVALTVLVLTAPGVLAQKVLILPGKWNVEQYVENPDYLQVCIDMRRVRPEIHVQGMIGTATLYARKNRFLKTARLSPPAGDLTPGKIYVFYVRPGVTGINKVYPISATARVAVRPSASRPRLPTDPNNEVKVYPTVPLEHDRKLHVSRIQGPNIRLLTQRPPRRPSR
jgi:hypothetical protein